MKKGFFASFILLGLLSSFVMSMTPLPDNSDDNSDELAGLYVSDSLICNDVTCYPKVFEATAEWREIKPGQQLPAGLDIRVNLETHLKEAKLRDTNAQESTTDSNTPAIHVDADDANSDREQPGATHEFEKDFDVVRNLVAKIESDPSSFTNGDVETMENKLDDLMEFAHDYKHGFEIVDHEFQLLRSVSFDERLPTSVRELSTRMMISCIRNNPRVIDLINQQYPTFVNEVFHEVKTLISTDHLSQLDSSLIKRYLSILNELLDDFHIFAQEEMAVLEKVYTLTDKLIRFKVLELISRVFTSVSEDQGRLSKRDIQDAVPNVQAWVDRLQKSIQDKDIDELHTRKFFNSLYNIKQEFKEVKVDSSFLDWLSTQTDLRKKQLDVKKQERDLEQDDFDKRLIDSRHLVFGNPMAHRVKEFNDEL